MKAIILNTSPRKGWKTGLVYDMNKDRPINGKQETSFPGCISRKAL